MVIFTQDATDLIQVHEGAGNPERIRDMTLSQLWEGAARRINEHPYSFATRDALMRHLQGMPDESLDSLRLIGHGTRGDSIYLEASMTPAGCFWPAISHSWQS